MSQWDDYTGDDWMRPLASKDTKTRHTLDRETRGIKPRPRLQDPPYKTGDHWGDFVLEEWIGSGTHGWVFAATEQSTGKHVALKILAMEDDPKATLAKTGFRRMSKLHHSNLMRLHGIHEYDGTTAFSMERIRGMNLTAAIRRWRDLPLAEACEHVMEMIRQVGAAIGCMHARQLVHRDLKPSNIMVTDDFKRFVVVDYDSTGIFQDLDAESMSGYLIWTPMYVPPEVLVRQRHTPSSDIFSLGMVILEALRVFSAAQFRREGALNNPSRPTDGTDESGGIPRHESDEAKDRLLIHEALRGLHAEIPEELVDKLDEMLASNEADRPMAIALSRLGLPPERTQQTKLTDFDSDRLREATQKIRHDELAKIHRWSHLVLGGQIQRLHISGDSGIGKSTLLDVALTSLRSQPWAQVFVARCQQRDQNALQAFSQIADEINMRYRRDDRERLLVDSVTVSLLSDILPSLGDVLEVDQSQPRLQTSSTRPGGLEAALRVCERLREYGPVFFVIDDVQWADRDTVSVLDYLQSASMNRPQAPELQGLGFITVSRPDGDQQITLPDATVHLGPLPTETTIEMLATQSEAFGLDITDDQLTNLADQIDGLPYRLDACLEELRPGGWLSNAIQTADPSSSDLKVLSMESMWQSRCEDLSPEAMLCLQRIAAAGRQLPITDLQTWHESSAVLESVLEELQRRRLIVLGESTEPTVQVWHSRLGEKILQELSEADIRQLHSDWGDALVRVRPDSANLIASHFQRAERFTELSHWAELAAKQAQQMYAHREVGTWYDIAARHADPERKIDFLRESALAWQRSGRLTKAANAHAALAELLEGPSAVEQQLRRTECLLRSGDFNSVRKLLEPLNECLQLPSPKSNWKFHLSVAWQVLRLLPHEKDLSQTLSKDPVSRSMIQSSQVEVCMRLIRPLTILDNNTAVEWSLYAARQVRLHGTKGERIYFGVGEAVFRSYSLGRDRLAAGESLRRLHDSLTPNDDPIWHGDVHCGMAWHEAMSGRYASSLEPCLEAKRYYGQSEHSKSFEIAHMSYLEFAAYFQCGRINDLKATVTELQVEGRSTNDQFLLIMATLGYGALAFLADDDLRRLETASKRVQDSLKQIGPDSFVFVNSIKEALSDLYLNEVGSSQAKLEWFPRQLRRSSVRRVQMVRVIFHELLAGLSLQSMLVHPKQGKASLLLHVKQLRREKTPFSQMKADFFEGIYLARFAGAEYANIAKQKLTNAEYSADDLKLQPFSLAARDELNWLDNPSAPSALEEFLLSQDISDPVRFARLYRGLDRPKKEA
ncbi:serine/threonine protein kinase [Rhodopirellula halodulae]|uniref:serine/threonine protein kinase n=1 Tax=Rhodopirellula halodulae TaxID=2894198 RepID=UPI001E421B20|nr:protein kinase [Rhodopirellula sp. JC737]MCC9658908.1 protein kinase [Rhodopirellula sp. JC737]